ncbi:MAG: Gfo/Idh/MocA family oxidoreductase [Planctomycetaceae bacterium]|nr:Gfo/Idh/MocA family oxidoreductase [Planctomycetaceae bacterium]
MNDFSDTHVRSSEPLRLAVIGVGALGQHHARLIAEMDDVTLAGVADPNPEQGSRVADSHRTTWFADYRTLLDRHNVDGVSIVVPTSLHRRIAEDCLRRGVPVLVEKPITPTVSDGDALCLLAQDQQLALQVGHIERFNPAFTELAHRTSAAKYVRAERLAPYSFRSTDVSVVLDLMIHDLDLLLALNVSGVRSVEALGMCVFGGEPDVVQARIHFNDGCIADLSASRVSPTVRRSFQVWSEAGCWTADLQEQTLTGIGPGPVLKRGELPCHLGLTPGIDIARLKEQVFSEFLVQQQPQVERRNALQDELRDFVRAIRTGVPPRVDGHAGVAAVRLATAIAESVDAHQWDGCHEARIGPYAHPLHAHHSARAA